ncbi:MAG: hypothetical protein ACKOXQ_09260 [Hydrogenophaga sp.]
MSYPLRLPPDLDTEARERAQRLGISLNALMAVALDAYLRAEPAPKPSPAPPAAKPLKPAKPAKPKASPRPAPEPAAQEGHPDWRHFHPDPDVWPYVDPEFEHRWEHVDDPTDEAVCIALELEYWSTRERPASGH